MSAFRCLSYAAAAISVSATPHSAALAKDEAVVLEPSSPWQLDYGKDRCRIARTFGEGDDTNMFYLEQWEPAAWATWLVAGPAVDRYWAGRPTNYSFGPGGDANEFKLRPVTLGDFGDAVTSGSTIVAKEEKEAATEDNSDTSHARDGLPELASEAASGIDSITVSQKGRSTVTLNLGSMEKPLMAMNHCMANLVAHWGFEITEQDAIAVAPEPVDIMPVARRIQRDYPTSALRAGAQADFQVRLTIEADGSISDCQLVNLTLADDFDMKRHPCAAFKELATYEAARTATGQPIRSYVIQRIRYTMSN